MFGDRNQGIFDQYRWILSRIQWMLDGVVVVLLLFFLCWLFDEPFLSRFQLLGLATFLLTVMVFQAANLHQPWRGANLVGLVRRVFLSWIVVIAILSVMGYVTKTSVFFSRKVVLTWMAVAPAALVALRLQLFLGLRWLRQQGRNTPPRGDCGGRRPGPAPGLEHGGHPLAGAASLRLLRRSPVR